MTPHHHWRDCRPALVSLDAGGTARVEADQQGRLDLAWSLVDDCDRRLFHAFCCLSVHTRETVDAMVRITALMT